MTSNRNARITTGGNSTKAESEPSGGGSETAPVKTDDVPEELKDFFKTFVAPLYMLVDQLTLSVAEIRNEKLLATYNVSIDGAITIGMRFPSGETDRRIRQARREMRALLKMLEGHAIPIGGNGNGEKGYG